MKAWCAKESGAKLELIDFDLGPLGDEEVEVKVEYCGLCHTDLSCIKDEFKVSQYPMIPGHEIIGHIVSLGAKAKGLKLGQRVGIGWNSGCCHHCRACIRGNQHLCQELLPTIITHPGGFAERVRANWIWAVPIPETLDSSRTAPLLCAGNTVYPPLLELGVKPTDRIGVLGIGGLGHLAIKFASALGCEVVAFSSNQSKTDKIKSFGASQVVCSTDPKALAAMAGSIDVLLFTTNVVLDWSAIFNTLRKNGKLHFLGGVTETVPIHVLQILFNKLTISASPTGSPSQMADMLEFAARHKLEAEVEIFPMSQVNQALDAMKNGKITFRSVLKSDF